MRSAWARSLRRLGLIGLLALGGCKGDLYANLSQQDANEMMALLMHDGLRVEKVAAKDGSDTIRIEQRDFARAVDVLKAHGLPRAKFSSINEVFQPSGLIASPVQEQARFLWALGQELAKTVSQIDGVLTARVQVVLPDNDLLKREPTPSSASVFIRYDEASQVAKLVSQIKLLVANSVQGLTYDKVSVVLVPVAHVEAPLPIPEPSPEWQGPALVGGAVVTILALALLAVRRRVAATLALVRASLASARSIEPAE